jgi:hypothetical protein
MRGQCFCTAVEFEIQGDHFKLYQCHCSQCRKQSGSSANAATIVPSSRFTWIRGKQSISSWTHESGFRSDFCSTCGSPVPNPLKSLPFVWVPAGLLENVENLAIIAHLCMASKASWDSDTLRGISHDQLPDLNEFITLLNSHD